MKTRSIAVCTLALAALGAAISSGIAFGSFDGSDLPAAWLLDISACLIVVVLGFTVRGGTFSIACLLGVLAACLPAAGPAIASLAGLSIHFMRPSRRGADPFVVGNPLTAHSPTSRPCSVLGRPLVTAVRSLSDINLFRLLTGIACIPPDDARPVLLRLRDGDDPQLQLFAQGGLNDAIEAAENHLKYLTRRAHQHPGECPTHCAIAEINLHLLENHLVEPDDRPAMWDAACTAIARALEADPKDALSLKTCARINLLGGDPEKARLAAEALATIPGHSDTARLLIAEAAYSAGDLETIAGRLAGIAPNSAGCDAILDFWRKPKPMAYT
jgi:hypothetical protein